MTTTITVEEAQAKLRDLLAALAPDDEIIITDNEKPVARLVGEQSVEKEPRQPGTCQGMLVIHSEDDEHLKDFEDYMP